MIYNVDDIIYFFKQYYLKFANIFFRNKINKVINSQIESEMANYNQYLVRRFGKSHFSNGLENNYLISLGNLCYKNMNNILTENEYLNFIKETNKLCYVQYKYHTWLMLYYLAVRCGLLRLGYLYRLFAIKSGYNTNTNNRLNRKINLLTKMSVCIDSGDIDEAISIFMQINILNLKEQQKLKISNFLSILNADSKYKIETYNNDDDKYGKLIYGKSVAIVGPGYSEDFSGREIDSYDFVIRVNFKGNQMDLDPEVYGSRTDISYYNKEIQNMITNGNLSIDKLYNLKFIIFKKIDKELSNIINCKANYRVLTKYDSILFSGKLNMIQNILLDVLRFLPKHVKIFKVNFYLSNKQYHDNYTSRNVTQKNNKNNWYSFAEHDFITQLNFCKMLYNSNRFDADDDCKKILLMNTKTYVQTMDSIY